MLAVLWPHKDSGFICVCVNFPKETMTSTGMPLKTFPRNMHMWQSCVEIKSYFVTYFNCIAGFEVPYRWTSVKGGTHVCFADAWISNESMKRMSSALNRSSAIWCFEGSNVIKIHNGITFNSTWDCHIQTLEDTHHGAGSKIGKWRERRNSLMAK